MGKYFARHKVASGLVGVVVLLAVIALTALNWMFEEPSVRHVKSVAHAVDATSVLGVFAHPDDEQLVTGFLIRAAKDEAIHTAALTTTRGEAGTQRPQVARQSDLGSVRKAEALKNTWALGVETHDVLDFPDGGLISTPIDELVAAVRLRMIEHKTDLVVTFWPESGFSGHADHMKMGLASEIAIRQLQESPVDGYPGPTHIAYALAPTRMMGRFAGEIGQMVVANQPPANISQPGEARAKLRGWKIHASQRYFVRAAYGLPAWLVHRLYDKEFYYLIETTDLPQR